MTTATTGWTATRSLDQHTWDDYPHEVWDAMPVTDLALYDVIAQTLQIGGIAAAEHRGKPAIRLDVENVVTGGKGRVVLTIGQVVSDVKRYRGVAGEPVAPTAAQLLVKELSARKEAVSTTSGASYSFDLAAEAWCDIDGGGADNFDDAEQRLFAFLCAGVALYSQRLADDRRVSDGDFVQEVAGTLQALGENLIPSDVVSDPRG